MNDQTGTISGWKLAGALLGGLLVAAVVGALAWLAFDTPAPVPQAARSWPNVWDQSIAPMPPPVTQVLDEALPDVAAMAPSAPAGRMEVCGLGVVSELDWNRRVRQQVAASDAAKTRQQVVDALLADRDEFTRAVALVLQSSGGAVVADEEVVCEGTACAAEPEKIESAVARQRRIAANTTPRDKLARMALVSRSPELYGLAWQVCRAQGRHDEPSACQLLSSDQWARLEPGNAVPWFEVANQAKQRGDRAAVAEALYRASHAKTSNARVGRLNERLLSRLPPGVSLLDAMAIGTELATIERSWPPQTAAVLNDYCSAPALRDTNRHQRCDAVADVLVSRGTVAAEVLEGARLGERLGWPKTRLAALSAELQTVLQASAAQLPDGSLSCESIARYLKYLKDVGEHGELMAGRRVVSAPAGAMADATPGQSPEARSQAAAGALPVNR